jgi:hypothetical protein
VSACIPAAASEAPERTRPRRSPCRGGKGEALGASGIDHLARNDIEMALLLAVPAAHVSAIESDYHSTTRRRGGPWVLFRMLPALCAPSAATPIVRIV